MKQWHQMFLFNAAKVQQLKTIFQKE